MKNVAYLQYVLLITIGLMSLSLFAQRDIPDKPKEEKPVYDYADMLDKEEEAQLNNKLQTYADSTSTQFVIVTIDDLKGEYIATYAVKWAQQWGIGQEGKDNGAIIMVSKSDRKMTIQNGYGLEPYLTDLNSNVIIDDIMRPEFKKQNFYQGFDKATDAMMDLLAGQFDPMQHKGKGKKDVSWSFIIFPLIIIVVFFILVFRRSKNKGGKGGSGGRRGSPDLLDILILSSLGGSHSSGGFGGGSSGGFAGGGGGFSGGFGGGGFGGGGAVGGW